MTTTELTTDRSATKALRKARRWYHANLGKKKRQGGEWLALLAEQLGEVAVSARQVWLRRQKAPMTEWWHGTLIEDLARMVVVMLAWVESDCELDTVSVLQTARSLASGAKAPGDEPLDNLRELVKLTGELALSLRLGERHLLSDLLHRLLLAAIHFGYSWLARLNEEGENDGDH